MNCPNCKNSLIKKSDTGEHIKFCNKCNSSWFILLTSKKENLKNEKNKMD